MKFEQIQIHRGSVITFDARFSSRDSVPHISFLHLAFSGRYRPGGEGAPDAHFIMGILKIAEGSWFPSATILDLSNLDYEWGNEMARILGTEQTQRFAIVVGEKCRRALSTLKYGKDTANDITDESNVFDSIDTALRYLAEIQVESWNESERRVGPPEDWTIISLGDLGIGG